MGDVSKEERATLKLNDGLTETENTAVLTENASIKVEDGEVVSSDQNSSMQEESKETKLTDDAIAQDTENVEKIDIEASSPTDCESSTIPTAIEQNFSQEIEQQSLTAEISSNEVDNKSDVELDVNQSE